MTRLFSRLAPSRPTLLLLVWLVSALGMVVQPVMAAAGEVHELAHDPSGSHLHPADNAMADSAPDSGAARGTPDNPSLHLLMDLAHCCGGTVAVLPALKIVSVIPVITENLAGSEASMLLTPRLPSPFKPPIVG